MENAEGGEAVTGPIGTKQDSLTRVFIACERWDRKHMCTATGEDIKEDFNFIR